MVLLFAGLRPEPVPQEFVQQDKLHHLLGLAVFVYTLRLAMPRLHGAWLAAIGLVAAALIELGQGLLPLRTASLADMGANSLGVLLGLALTRLRWGRAPQEEKSPGDS